MRKTSITLLLACIGACGAIALNPDRRSGHPPTDPATGLVEKASPEHLAVAERSAKKVRLMKLLIAGDLRLVDAVETVIALNRDWPPLPPERYEFYPGQSLRERVAHMLVGAVEHRVAADDPRRDEILVN